MLRCFSNTSEPCSIQMYVPIINSGYAGKLGINLFCYFFRIKIFIGELEQYV